MHEIPAHERLADAAPIADLVTASRKRAAGGAARFSWGSANLQDAGEVRRRHIAALQAADNHDVGPLLAFARS